MPKLYLTADDVRDALGSISGALDAAISADDPDAARWGMVGARAVGAELGFAAILADEYVGLAGAPSTPGVAAELERIRAVIAYLEDRTRRHPTPRLGAIDGD